MKVRTEFSQHVATLTLDDAPRRNAMSPALGDALREAVHAVPSLGDVRAVVLTGAGGAFSAGGDLAMLEQLRRSSHAECVEFMLGFYGRYLSLLELPVPVLAAIEGPAIGAGLCVALACDLCVVAEDAKLALNFVCLGLHPGMGATYFAPRRFGPQRAAELLYTGRRFDGREAAAWGMASRVAPPGQALAEAQKLAAQIAANGPLAVRGLKKSLAHDAEALRAALAAEAAHQADSYASEDLGEGLRAAAERRAPVFTGR